MKKRLDNFEINFSSTAASNKRDISHIREVIIDVLAASSSKSWIGFHANLYFKEFQKPSWENSFDSEWGSIHGFPEGWIERDLKDIKTYITKRAPYFNIGIIEKNIDYQVSEAKNLRNDILSELVLIENNERYTSEQKAIKDLSDFSWGLTQADVIDLKRPKQAVTRDSFALHQGIMTPPHEFYDGILISCLSKIEQVEDFVAKCKRLLRQIEIKCNYHESIKENRDTDKALTILLNIFDRFHFVARQLRHRYSNRETLKITDEYDVQDLLHALLKMNFDDIRPEEWNPSYAGGSTRSDFLLKPEQVVLEIKKTRPSMTDKDLGNQLIIDVAKYKQHPDCKVLICFVYDPEGIIGNSKGMEDDLNKLSTENMRVLTIIRPL
ncbi:hypothetical protein [Paenibacillus alvei]|uniref:PD-(D/E)XK nuclease domain-containing protein n=1 Tax=Paenibacillus alvei TaxID=44250 RepID=UPI003D301F19